MNKVLIAGFKGIDNSAKIVLNKLTENPNIEKLYLENNFSICAEQITEKIRGFNYIFAFGQKPAIKSIYLETKARADEYIYPSEYDYTPLETFLKQKGYRVQISENAGNYLCNHVYAAGLHYIKQYKLKTRFLFMHIPYLKNFNAEEFADTFSCFLNSLI